MIRTLARTASVGLVLLGLVSCRDIAEPVATDPEEIPQVARTVAQVGQIAELPGAAVGVSISVVGSFQPGVPLVIRAEVVPTSTPPKVSP